MGRRGLGVRCPGRKGLHVGKTAVFEHISNILGEVARRGVKHETGDDALSVPHARGLGRVVEVELGELIDELSKEQQMLPGYFGETAT